MELRERLTRSRASQEDAKCEGRPVHRLTGKATAAAQSPERPRARRLQPRKTFLRLSCLLPALVCVATACALTAAVQGAPWFGGNAPPVNPLTNPEFFKDFKPSIVTFVSDYGSDRFDKEYRKDLNYAIGNNNVPPSSFSLCSLLEVFVNERWSRSESRLREFITTGNFQSLPTFDTYCVKGNAELGNGNTWGATNGFVTDSCNEGAYMATTCLQTGGSVTVDATDAKGVVHHIMVVLHPSAEPPLDPSEPFFRTYLGGPEDRAAYLAALTTGEEPTVPAVLHAKRACVPNPYSDVNLSAAAACVAAKLEATVFNRAPPRAVALIPAHVDVGAAEQPAFRRGHITSDKICIERIPDLVFDLGLTIFNLYVLHPQPSSIPQGPLPPPP